MAVRVAINGLGRIGKLLVRALVDREAEVELVLLNDPVGDAALHAQLLEFDTVHGRWPVPVAPGDGGLAIGRHQQPRLTHEKTIRDLPLDTLGVDVAVDCTGVFKTVAALAPYFEAGVRKVVGAAPIHDDRALNLVYGVNQDRYNPARYDVVTAASCTTNCLAPVVKVVHEALGIAHGSMTTIHDATNTQTIVDRPAKDPRRARSALNSLIPTTTGSAKAIGLIYPELEGRLNGHAVRVPLLTGSLTDCVFELKRETAADEVNALFAAAATDGPLAGILGYEPRPLVSSDFRGDPRSAIVDGPSTMVVNATQLKVYAWYDNEWGYTMRLADVLQHVADRL
jgi:glyceraldehyde 3-phosphate dehydrogenase